MVHCPTCGGGLRFEIESQRMFCEHCLNRFDPKSLYDKMSEDAKTAKTFDSYVYVCPSCGGELQTTDKNDAVGFCPYCGGASMIYDKIRKEWKPEAVVPFAVTKEQCKQLYCDSVKKHLFVSKKYRDPALIESFRGIYVPYYSMQGEIDGELTVRAKSEEVKIAQYDYQTSYYDVTGPAAFKAESVNPHDASVAFDDHLSERLAPFDRRGEVPFTPGYLCGFYAESGDLSENECSDLMQGDISDAMYDAIENDNVMKGALSRDKLTIDRTAPDVQLPVKMKPAKRLLYPVWFMSYRRGDKITYATVNGQTGKVAADLPLSPLRILLAALAFSAVLFGLLFLAMRFLPSIPAAATLGISAAMGITGMYLMQFFYVNTVGKTLHEPEMTRRLPFSFVFFSVLMFIAVIMMTTDGSYAQSRYTMGLMLLIPSLIVVIVNHSKLRKLTRRIKSIQLTTDSMLANGVLVEAKKFNRINGLVRIFLYIWYGICFVMMHSDTSNNLSLYAMSAVSAIGLFALALLHINFQSKIAKRRLPQFNKKGAAYDEN